VQVTCPVHGVELHAGMLMPVVEFVIALHAVCTAACEHDVALIT
jgi:hypothetical protein